MIAVLRFLSFATGIALVAAPSYLLLLFAHGVGKAPASSETLLFLLAPFTVGLVLGGGLLLVGLPGVVAGPSTPNGQLAAGALMVLSASLLAFVVGFSGSVTRFTTPVFLLAELVIFLVFIWPAKSFKYLPAGGGQPNDG